MRNVSQRQTDPFYEFITQNPHLKSRIKELQEKGREHIRNGQYKQSITCFKQALRYCSFDPIAFTNIGTCYFLMSKYKDAIAVFKENLKLYPQHTVSLALLARNYRAVGDLQQAQATLRKAEASCVRSNPNWNGQSEAFTAMVSAYSDFNDHLSILRLMRRKGSLELPEITLYQAGVAAFNAGQYRKAYNWWKKAAMKTLNGKWYLALIKTTQLLAAERIPPFELEYWPKNNPKEQPADASYLTGAMKCTFIYLIWAGKQDRQQHIIAIIRTSTDPWAELFLRALLLQADLPQEVKNAAYEALIDRGALVPPSGQLL